MIKNHINLNYKKKRLVALAATAVGVMFVVSIATIGAAPLSVQQQGREQAPGQSVTSSNIVDGEVKSADIGNEEVTNEDLADDAVTSDKISNGEVTSEDIEDGTITSADLAPGTIPSGGGTPDDNSVTSATIVDGEVKSADIGNGEVTSANIGDGQVATQDLANGAVTADKIASDAIELTTRPVIAIHPVNPSELVRAEVSCPPGETATGGGFHVGSGVRVFTSAPNISNGWTVNAFNDNPIQVNVQVTVYCATITP